MSRLSLPCSQRADWRGASLGGWRVSITEEERVRTGHLCSRSSPFFVARPPSGRADISPQPHHTHQNHHQERHQPSREGFCRVFERAPRRHPPQQPRAANAPSAFGFSNSPRGSCRADRARTTFHSLSPPPFAPLPRWRRACHTTTLVAQRVSTGGHHQEGEKGDEVEKKKEEGRKAWGQLCRCTSLVPLHNTQKPRFPFRFSHPRR